MPRFQKREQASAALAAPPIEKPAKQPKAKRENPITITGQTGMQVISETLGPERTDDFLPEAKGLTLHLIAPLIVPRAKQLARFGLLTNVVGLDGTETLRMRNPYILEMDVADILISRLWRMFTERNLTIDCGSVPKDGKGRISVLSLLEQFLEVFDAIAEGKL